MDHFWPVFGVGLQLQLNLIHLPFQMSQGWHVLYFLWASLQCCTVQQKYNANHNWSRQSKLKNAGGHTEKSILKNSGNSCNNIFNSIYLKYDHCNIYTWYKDYYWDILVYINSSKSSVFCILIEYFNLDYHISNAE